MATQQEIDAQTGLHNTSGYDQNGGRLPGGQVDDFGTSTTPTNQAIQPSALKPTPALQPIIAQPTATPTVPDFLAINPQEQQVQDQYTQGNNIVADLMGQLAGRDAYTTVQQQQQDVIGKQTAVQKYQNQIKALQQEASGISLQREQNIQAKQQAMSGQGIASGIVNRHSAIDTQYNQQILTNAIKQYQIGAGLSAAQGDLTSALNYVDQAVKLKYEPIEAQITAQNANLEAIKNNPAFTSAQRKEAAAQQFQLQQYTQNIADQKKTYQDTQDAIIKTITNNPNITSAQQAAIHAAQSPEEVAMLVNHFGLSSVSQSDMLDQTYKQAQIDKMNYDLAHPKLNTQVIEGAGGHTQLINTDTGALIKDYGAKAVTMGVNGTYTAGENPSVDAWASRIQSGQAKITDIPATNGALRNAVTIALDTMGNSPDGKPTTTELGKAALSNAEALMKKLEDGTGTSAVGGSRFLGGGLIDMVPGTNRYGFVNDFNAVKAQLALEGVKYLKGQGQVSDAERALLSQAVTKLNLSQSEAEFKTTLQSIIDKLKGTPSDADMAAQLTALQPGAKGTIPGSTVTFEILP